jgi:glucosylceramidase
VPSGTADVTVDDASSAGQTWDGFGGTFNEAGWNVLSMLDAADRDRAMRLLFDAQDGARFVQGRIPVGASDYAVDRYTLNDTPNDAAMANFSIARDRQRLIPYIKAALAINPNVRFWASPWTPPAWMKDNNRIDGGNMRDDATVLQAFALYLARFVEEYGKEGIPIEAVHPQNEPSYSLNYPSCSWTPALMIRFIRDHLGPTFTSRGVPAHIYLGTMSNADAGKDPAFISALLADPAAAGIVKGFGLQWNMIGSVAGLRSRNLPIVQTEHKCGNYYWETATFNRNQAPNDHAYALESWGYIRDWVRAGVTSYSAWNMVLDTAGKSIDAYLPWPQNALLTVDTAARTLIPTPAYYVFRHASQYAAPGAQVVNAIGADALAFKNPDGSLVAIVHNPGATARSMIVAMGGKRLQISVPASGFATVNLP